MTALVINDLNIGKELDRQALAKVIGRGMWHLKSKSYSMSGWSGYQLLSSDYQGITYHDGYQSKHYIQKWKRTRTQTEYSSWDKYVRV